MAEPPACPLVKGFIVRQGVLLAASCLFLAFSAARIKLGKDKRDLRTFLADVSKQACQQMLGGTMMMVLGLELAKRGQSALSWYGAEYPFEVILTTVGTGVCRRWAERFAKWGYHTKGWAWLEPHSIVGQYGPRPGDFSWRWYRQQLLQAVVFIAVPSRVVSIALIYCSIAWLPPALNPIEGLANLWFWSGWSCSQQQAAVLYAVPLLGDATQFIIIDRLQAAGVNEGKLKHRKPAGRSPLGSEEDLHACGLLENIAGSSSSPAGSDIVLLPSGAALSCDATVPEGPPPHGAELSPSIPPNGAGDGVCVQAASLEAPPPRVMQARPEAQVETRDRPERLMACWTPLTDSSKKWGVRVYTVQYM